MAPQFRRALRLRTRVTLFFSLTALVASLALALVTYALARSFLTSQRESVARTQAFSNASGFKSLLQSVPESTSEQITIQMRSVPTESSGFAMLEIPSATGERQFLSDQNYPEDAFPASLREMVTNEQSGQQRFSLDGEPYVAVGVFIRSADARYLEAFPLTDTNRTLGYLATAMAIGAGVTTLLAAGLGWWTSRRLLRPLSRVSTAASEIASGGLDARMPPEADPDLALLASSFNGMADAVQTRIEREVRFASDVSHELRSPLMTMAAAAEVLESQRDDLSDRGQQAVDLVTDEIGRFRQLVEDLLEMSRYDAGAVRIDHDDVRLAEFVLQAVDHSGHRGVPIEIDADLAGVVVQADKRRLARVLANLLDNAAKYGDGATSVSLRRIDGNVQLAVEDLGPGVPEEERAQIFHRFYRGRIAGRRGTGEGVGLGLALVAEHVRLHGGRVWVEDRADQQPGARFVVELPAEEDPS